MPHEQQQLAATTACEVTRNPKVVVQTADVRVVEYVLEPGEAQPWHYHSQVSDRFYCLEGQIGVATRAPSKEFVLRPGQSCEVSPRTVHRVSNAGDGTSRYLLLQALGKYDFIRIDEGGQAR
jgi:quercetin dioxygenase-like cupin family protein